MQGNPTYDELLAANAELQKKLEQLEADFRQHQNNGMKIKSHFLSNISHEIRTPMNAILGFSNLLQNNGLTENELDEYLFYIDHSSQTLLTVMDNIIDLSLLETENIELSKEEVDLQQLIEEVFEHHNWAMTRTEGERVAILMSTPDNGRCIMVNADSTRLRRIMTSLIATILKYQKSGVIELKLEIPEKNRVAFSVNFDRNAELLKRAEMIFENIESAEDWHSQKDAAGMTFKMSHDLVAAMGGELHLNNSESGNRLEIKIEFPIHSIKKEKRGAESRLNLGEITA